MGSKRSESWGRYDRYRENDGRGWDTEDERRERGREPERRHDERRGFSADGRGEGPRPVKCYECGELGHYKSQCPRLQGRFGGGGGILNLSREIEESLSAVGKMAKQVLDKQREVEAGKQEAEAKLKKEEEEKAKREEEARVALEKKQAKEEKEKKKNWELRKLLAKQAEEYELKMEKLVGLSKKLKGVTIGTKERGKMKKVSSSSEDADDDEAEEEATPLKDKRKRRDPTGGAVNSPPVETPKKHGKQEGVDTPTSQRRKGRGRPSKADAQAARMEKGEDPWEGVPMGEKFATEAAYRKVVRRAIGSFYPETLKLMCKGAGLPFYGVNDAIDTLTELRVTNCYRGKKAPSQSSSRTTEDEQIRGEIQDPQDRADLEPLESKLIRRWCPGLNVNGWKDGRNRKKKRRKGRKERKKKKREYFDEEKVLRFYDEKGKSSGKLSELIKSIKGKKERSIVSSGGKIWLEDWGVIKRVFGESDMLFQNARSKLRNSKHDLEQGGEVRFMRVRERTSGNPVLKKQLYQLLKCPWSKKKLDDLQLDQLIDLYQETKCITRKCSRKSLRDTIDKVLKRKFGVNLRRRVVVGVKYDDRISRAEIRKYLVKKIGEQSLLPAEAKPRCQKLRMVWRKNQTVGCLLHNHRRFSRLLATVCSCADLQLPRQGEHVAFRLSSRGEVDSRIRNAKNVVRGIDSSNEEIKLCTELNEEMKKAGLEPTWTLHQARSCIQKRRGSQDGLIDEVEKVKQKWDGLVFCQLDKNPSETLVMCPVLYEEAMRTMFWENKAFDPVWRREEEVMVKAKKEFEEKGLTTVGSWNGKGSWGKAYVLPKHKDTSKFRPISPSFPKPARLANQRVTRALNLLLFSLPKNCNFNLKSTNLMKSRLDDVNKWASKKKKGELKGVAYDIKEMSSRLPHDSVRKAIDCILSVFERKGKKHLLVRTRGKGASFGVKKGEEGWVKITFEMIRQMVDFDLSNAFIWVSDRLIRRREGIPMGKSSSPPIACILCAFYEFKFLNSLGKDVGLVRGIRLVDDVSLFVWQGWDKKNRGKVDDIISRFEKAYDPKLALKKTDDGQNEWSFLGCRMKIEVGVVVSWYRAKNFKEI
ncbi:hypothetical protein CBR_g8270 [Chara braunii]|uniref:CCHC-type domain-containing protein n=1 Tax=Chara braunii TaxID=69332 RepID=A0A388KLP7_CHABU|nr:hypothetical protein CBR_g8270 [Chara braunii]|eukprot:GBG70970.1 hypothetical protein CBR_g8270 [Chara braunii]